MINQVDNGHACAQTKLFFYLACIGFCHKLLKGLTGLLAPVRQSPTSGKHLADFFVKTSGLTST
jgi:hypothetical protein